MSRFIRRALYLLVPTFMLAGFGLAAAAGPALAASCGPPNCASSTVTVSATVASSLTMSGISSPISFGTVLPGQSNNAIGFPANEVFSVSTNDPAGYILTIAGSNTPAVLTSGSSSIPNSAFQVTENNVKPGGLDLSGLSPSGTEIDTEGGAGTYNYSESWKLDPPAGTPGGTYSGTVTYMAAAF